MTPQTRKVCLVVGGVLLLGHCAHESANVDGETGKPVRPVHHAAATVKPAAHVALASPRPTHRAASHAPAPVHKASAVAAPSPAPIKPRATEPAPTDIRCWNEANRKASGYRSFAFDWVVTYSDGSKVHTRRSVTEAQFSSYSTVPGHYPCTFQGA